MKKSTVIALIIGAVLLLAGIIVFAAVIGRSHGDYAALSNARFVTTTVDIEKEFRNISIDSDTDDITFLPSKDGKCRVVFYESEKEKHTASVENGTLMIRKTDTRTWYENITVSFDTPKTALYLPGSAYASLSIKESTGEIEIPADFSFESIDIKASTGSVSCKAPSSGLFRIKTSTGSIAVENITAVDLDLSVSTGRVDVHSAVCSGSVGIGVSTGRAALTDVTCKSLVSDGDTGSITLDNVICEEKLYIKRTTGSVKMEKCDAAELEIETDTGDVAGSLLSDKVFIVRSDTGSINVPETTTGGKCKITSNTGSIRISISQ